MEEVMIGLDDADPNNRSERVGKIVSRREAGGRYDHVFGQPEVVAYVRANGGNIDQQVGPTWPNEVLGHLGRPADLNRFSFHVVADNRHIWRAARRALRQMGLKEYRRVFAPRSPRNLVSMAVYGTRTLGTEAGWHLLHSFVGANTWQKKVVRLALVAGVVVFVLVVTSSILGAMFGWWLAHWR